MNRTTKVAVALIVAAGLSTMVYGILEQRAGAVSITTQTVWGDLRIVLAAGLIVMPAIEKVKASNPSDTRNKGQQGELTRALPRSHPGLGCSPWDPRC